MATTSKGFQVKKKLAAILAGIIVFSTVFLALMPHIPSALAQFSWTDTINLYKDVTAVYTDIRNITNNETVSVDVRVYITFTENITLLGYYRLSANNTDFIIISEGEVPLSSGAYYGLEQGQTLSFNVWAKGASSLSVDDIVRVGVKVEFWSRILGDITGPDGLPDGVVDIYDLGFLARAYGTKEGDFNWDEYHIADISGYEEVPDGVVDTYDLSASGRNYGKSQPW